MNEFEDLTIGKISMIIDDILKGKAEPKEAKYLFNYFVFLNRNNKPIPKELTELYEKATIEMFTGKKSRDQAFGIKKKRGRPNSESELSCVVASVLELMIEGYDKKEAINLVAPHANKHPQSIVDIFEKYKCQAAVVLRMDRCLEGEALTLENLEVLNNICHEKG